MRFVEVSVDGSKHCKLRRISVNNASKGDFGTVLGKYKNAMRRRQKNNILHARSVGKAHAETTQQIAVPHGIDFGQTSGPLAIHTHIYIYTYT